MEKAVWKSFAKRFAIFALALGCVATSFGASAYGACELYEKAQERAAEAAVAARDPYDLGFYVEDSEKDLEVDTYQEGTFLHYLYMFGSDSYDMYFDRAAGEVTAESLKGLVANNDGIPAKFKERVCEFVDEVLRKYPDVDLRVFEHNLADIVIVDCEAEQIHKECNINTAGYYSASENVICLSSNNGYIKYTWDYQVLTHELCHAMRQASFEDGELDVSMHPQAWPAEVVNEAFTSIVAASLLGYQEDNLAYQPEVNMVRVMLDCVEGYELCDYYRQSLPYFASKLDETCGDHNYAMTVFKLMQAQHDDYYDEEVNRDRAAYHPIYDYLARMYLDKYAFEGMSPGSVDRLMTELANRVSPGVPDDYGIDVGELYRFGQEYYAEKYGFDNEVDGFGC